MATAYPFPAVAPPMPAVARILAQFDRPKLEGFITVAIGLLDVMDGDCDIESNGDELDESLRAEDCFGPMFGDGPGCPLTDPGGCEHDGREHDDHY